MNFDCNILILISNINRPEVTQFINACTVSLIDGLKNEMMKLIL